MMLARRGRAGNHRVLSAHDYNVDPNPKSPAYKPEAEIIAAVVRIVDPSPGMESSKVHPCTLGLT